MIGEPVVFNAEKLSGKFILHMDDHQSLTMIILDLSGVNPFVPVNDNQTLLEVLKVSFYFEI